MQNYRRYRQIHADKFFQNHTLGSDTGQECPSIESVTQDHAIRQEIFYNLGRAASEIGLFNFALDNYYRALEIEDDCCVIISRIKGEDKSAEVLDGFKPVSSDQKLPLTRHSAFNSTLILKKSQAVSEAYRIMSKYLRI